MRKVTVLLTAMCILISGCGAGLSNVGIYSGKEIFNVSTTYFDNYISKKDDDTCKVQGTIHQMAGDRNGILTYVTAEDEPGSITVTGNMDCKKGSIRLVYTAQDGTETLIAEGSDRNFDMQVDVAQGGGMVNFVSDGDNAVCKFKLKIEAYDPVSLGNGGDDFESMESIEDIEIEEDFEKIEDLEADIDMPDFMEDTGFDFIQDNWPESIRYSADGIYANPLVIPIEIDRPMTLSLACMTLGGDLRLKIVDEDREIVYFDETDPDGTYTVDIQNPGNYQMLLYAKYHVGDIVVTLAE